MRTPHTLFLAVAFVAAVILPNAIGTNELPQLDGKCTAAKMRCHFDKSSKGGLAAGTVLIHLVDQRPSSANVSELWQGALLNIASHVNFPLLT